jgi:hypothetical protein
VDGMRGREHRRSLSAEYIPTLPTTSVPTVTLTPPAVRLGAPPTVHTPSIPPRYHLDTIGILRSHIQGVIVPSTFIPHQPVFSWHWHRGSRERIIATETILPKAVRLSKKNPLQQMTDDVELTISMENLGIGVGVGVGGRSC